MTSMGRLILAGGATALAAALTACSGTVVVGDDGSGGDGGAPGTASTATTTKATGVTSTAGPSGPAGPTGGCPADPGFQGCGMATSVGATGGLPYGCDVVYCDPQGGEDLFARHCTTEDFTCTCKGPSGTCVCDWNGDCTQPCCGN